MVVAQLCECVAEPDVSVNITFQKNISALAALAIFFGKYKSQATNAVQKQHSVKLVICY
ncbi:hypothetical protein DSUL_80042 [Desulfovibrionales bacterium]